MGTYDASVGNILKSSFYSSAFVIELWLGEIHHILQKSSSIEIKNGRECCRLMEENS